LVDIAEIIEKLFAFEEKYLSSRDQSYCDTCEGGCNQQGHCSCNSTHALYDCSLEVKYLDEILEIKSKLMTEISNLLANTTIMA